MYVACSCSTKSMVVVTSLFNLVISSFPDNMFYHIWTWLMIYHDGSNNVVQVCSFIKLWTVCSNIHEQTCQQPCSSWPAQLCSSLSTGKNKPFVFTCVVYLKKQIKKEKNKTLTNTVFLVVWIDFKVSVTRTYERSFRICANMLAIIFFLAFVDICRGENEPIFY